MLAAPLTVPLTGLATPIALGTPTTGTLAVSAVSRQLQRTAAESSGSTKKRKNGLVVPFALIAS